MSNSDRRPATILIVDDDEINRRVLLNFLAMKNYDVHTAESGMEALEITEASCDLPSPGLPTSIEWSKRRLSIWQASRATDT